MCQHSVRWFLPVVLCGAAAAMQEISAAGPQTEQASRVRRHLARAEAGPPYPRLGRATFYTPSGFAATLRESTGGQIAIADPHQTALLDFLSAHQLVDVYAGSYLGQSATADRERLAQAKANAGFLLLGIWGTSGNEWYWSTFSDTSPDSPWPFVPEWSVQELAAPLPQAVHAGDRLLPIADGEQDAYCLSRDTGDQNDQVIVLDPVREHIEAVVLKCSVWDHHSLSIPLTTKTADDGYAFGLFKHDHAARTPVRLNLWHSWGTWWGYNMTDLGPTYLGLRWNEYRPRIIHSQFKQVRDNQGTLLFDGANLDTFNSDWFGPYSSSQPVVERLDLDADGRPDLTQPDPPYDPANCFPDYSTGRGNWDNCAWATGETTFARNLRELWEADPELAGHDILVQHEFGENAEYMNGQSFENLPTLETSRDMNASRWQTAYEHYQYWQNQGRSPSTNFFQGLGDPTNYAHMRLSLAFTLLGNGYFYHSDLNADAGIFSGNTIWWFDEFAVDSTGRAIDVYPPTPPHPLINIRPELLEQGQFAATVRPGLGYLGYPTGPARVLAAGVYRRDFQKGLVLANFSGAAASLILERPFRRIAGVQDRATNDGSFVTSLDLPAKDGLVLLDPTFLAARGDARY